MGLRLRETLRHRPSRLPNPNPGPQGERAVPHTARRAIPRTLAGSEWGVVEEEYDGYAQRAGYRDVAGAVGDPADRRGTGQEKCQVDGLRVVDESEELDCDDRREY